MTVDTVVHNDLYHPVPRRRTVEPVADVDLDVLIDLDPVTPAVSATASPQTA